LREKQSFLKGVVLLAAAGFIVKIVGFIYRVILTNLNGYGDEGNGIYGAGYQVYLVLYSLSTTGFPAAISKMVAEKTAFGDWRGAHKIFKVSFWLLFTIGSVVSILFFMGAEYIANLISNPRAVYTMAAIAPAIFFTALMAVYRGYFQGMQDMTPQAGSQIIEQVAKMIFTILLAYLLLPYGVEMAAAGATAGTTIGAAIALIYLVILYKKRMPELRGKLKSGRTFKTRDSSFVIVKNLASISIPISFGALILTVANIIDLGTVMNQLAKAGFDSKSANQLYGILTGKCYVLAHFPVSIFVALATGLVPAISAAVAVKNYRSASEKVSVSLRITTLLGLPASIGMAVLAEPILKMLFPGSSEGAYLLTLSAFTIIFSGLTQTLSGILQGLGKALVPALSLFAGAIVKLVINFTLVPMPHINIKGAVYGTIACYMVSSAINYFVLKRNLKLNLSIYDFIMKPAAASIFMGISAYYVHLYLFGLTCNIYISTLTTIFIAVVVFALSILLLGGVSEQDIAMLPFGHDINKLLKRTKLIRRGTYAKGKI